MKPSAAIPAFAVVAALAAGSLLLHPGRRLAASYTHPAIVLPGVTLDRMTTPEGPRLVVTSTRFRQTGALDLEVGDRLEDVDGHATPSLAALHSALDDDHAATLRLHVRRHDRLLTILFDRSA